MTYSWGREAPPAEVDEAARARLADIADALIPEAHGMPAASAVGIGAGQLDAVLHARPDLLDPLRRALAAPDIPDIREMDAPPSEAVTLGPDARTSGPAQLGIRDWLAELARQDPDAHAALVLVVLAGYYWSEPVKAELGYPGQQTKVVSTAFPAYIEEGLLDPVIERGPIYRSPPEGPAPET
jgi:hypothetical protein